ncbi:MAG: ABC transporter ATP-binding protein [Bacteroidetes bacterium]|jgi:Cu-processing system ATP-binding protein|nr:ABC transporter ATP-binding protein [Bacteroidota bacterium]
MIKIQNISKTYNKIAALKNVSVNLFPSQSIALIGPNGSGKSTLMKCILGLVFPDKGTIEVMGEKITFTGNYRKKIGYMPQIVRFPDNMKVGQLFNMIQDIREEKINIDRELIEQFEINSFINKPLGALSGGMKQKVNAALAFMFNPDILILDEPTAGLDPLSAELLKDKIKNEKEKGKLIIISSHILADLEEITTHVVYLIDGELEFFKSMDSLIKETGTQNLSKAIAKIMTEIKVVHENN